jgi:DNA uptake protein ComE-like DNA-binding protein
MGDSKDRRRNFMSLKQLVGLVFAGLTLTLIAFGQITPPTFPSTDDKSKAELVDINSASQEELAALGGIGGEYADKVIAGRPYKNKKELKTRKILPAANYKQVADKITVKPVASKPKH